MARKQTTAPRRIAVCTFAGEIGVGGSVRSYRLTAGAEVDLDEVVGIDGNGAPTTLEAALGPYAAHFELATPAARQGNDEAAKGGGE